MKLRKLLVVLGAVMGVTLLTPQAALAVNAVDGFCNQGGGGGTLVCEAGQDGQAAITGNNGIVRIVAQTLVYVAAIIAVVLFVIAGFKYTTSQGDSGNIKSAKDTALYALVGLIIAIVAQLIVQFFVTRIFQ